MRVEIKEDRSIESTYVEIKCREVTKEVSRLKIYIDNFRLGISAIEDGGTHIVALEQILYIESVDKRTYIYTDSKVLETDKRLYELKYRIEFDSISLKGQHGTGIGCKLVVIHA